MKAINKLNDDFDKGKPIPANRLEIAEFAEAYEVQQNEELKELVNELFEYHPNTKGYDDVKKELLKIIKQL
jgi:hypothetical protein